MSRVFVYPVEPDQAGGRQQSQQSPVNEQTQSLVPYRVPLSYGKVYHVPQPPGYGDEVGRVIVEYVQCVEVEKEHYQEGQSYSGQQESGYKRL